MSFSDAFAVNTITVYSKTVNEFGDTTTARVGVVKCEYMQGGKMQRDENGTEFVPMSTFYPVDSSVSISRGDFVYLGDSTEESLPIGSEEVRKVSISGDDYFGRGNDIEVFTG